MAARGTSAAVLADLEPEDRDQYDDEAYGDEAGGANNNNNNDNDAANGDMGDDGDAFDDEEEDVPVDDPSLDADLENEFFGEMPVTLDNDTSNIIVVDNIPIVDETKFGKLEPIVLKIFEKYGTIKSYDIPLTGEPKKTVGYLFIEYTNSAMAEKAVKEGDRFKLDKAHLLRVTLFDYYDAIKDTPAVFEAKMEDYKGGDNLQSWLLDPNVRDQYVLRHEDDTEIYWNDPYEKPRDHKGRSLVYDGQEHKENKKKWTELITKWSPTGTYLATFHVQGILLWGGDRFTRQQRFPHGGAQFIEFSPNEKYLITCNGQDADPECIIIWDVKTGHKLRAFPGMGSQAATLANMFKFSYDDQYFARVTKDKHGADAISVYSTKDMGLLDKKSIRVPRVRDIAWSPSDNLLAYWVPEFENTPAKVSILEIPSRNVHREKHLYSVADVKMHWQSRGDYLCVKITRQKTKKTQSTNFEIFRMRSKEVPVEALELDDQIVAFAWEPAGHRFAIIHSPVPFNRTHVSFYRLQTKKLSLIATLEDRPANCLFWSPVGDQIVLAGLDLKTGGDDRSKKDGTLEFVDVGTKTVTSMCQRSHYQCTDVEWDPTGRYILTSVTLRLLGFGGRLMMESGYKVWSFDGKGSKGGVWVETTGLKVDKLFQAMWRPRPPCLLPASKQQAVLKSLKDKYWKQFAEEDEQIRRRTLSDIDRVRLQATDSWKKYRESKTKQYTEEAHDRRDLRGGMASDDEEEELIEETIETELSAEIEIISSPAADEYGDD